MSEDPQYPESLEVQQFSNIPREDRKYHSYVPRDGKGRLTIVEQITYDTPQSPPVGIHTATSQVMQSDEDALRRIKTINEVPRKLKTSWIDIDKIHCIALRNLVGTVPKEVQPSPEEIEQENQKVLCISLCPESPVKIRILPGDSIRLNLTDYSQVEMRCAIAAPLQVEILVIPE